MPYAERVNPSRAPPPPPKATTLPMPVAAFHNDEPSRISSLYSFVRRKCVEYFEDEEVPGRVGLRCAFCSDLDPEEREEEDSEDSYTPTKQQAAFVFPKSVVSIHAAVITLQYGHLPYCSEVPESVMEHMEVLKENDLMSPPKKRYRWTEAADEMGFKDSEGDAGSSSEKMICFVPPVNEVHYGRKQRGYNNYSSSNYSLESGSATNSPKYSGGIDAVQQQQQQRADWTDEDDMKLWKGQEELGNRWKEISEQVFNLTFRGDQVRNRWYSSAFKDFADKKFGRGSYTKAQALGKQTHGNFSSGGNHAGGNKKGGGNGKSAQATISTASGWTSDDDMKLWKAQEKLGNRWKEMSVELGRTAEHVKTRWYSDKFKDFVASEFGKGAYVEAHKKGKQERSGARPQVDWSTEDDALLWEARKEYGNKWESISTIKFESRMSENHVKNRWYSAAFKKFVAEAHGENAYQEAKIGRRGAQCQVDWTAEDDAVLWTSHEELGNRWGEIAATRFASRGINENQVKNRWYSAPFKKFVAAEFGPEAHRNAKHKK